MNPPDRQRHRREESTAPRRVSYGQEQLWFLEQMAPGEPTYNIPVLHRLRGALDVEALEDAIRFVVQRHDVLRSTFTAISGEPFQVVSPPRAFRLSVDDLSGLPAEPRRAEADRIVAQEVTASFDLSQGPLFRFRLIRLSADEHLFCVNVHHIVADGWSMGLMERELSEKYRSQRAGREPDLPELPDGYADFAARQRSQFQSGRLESQLRYWEQQLDGVTELDLPTDRPRPATFSFRGAHRKATFPADLVTRLRGLARSESASLFMVLTTAFAIVLARYSGQDEIPLGATMLGRTDPSLERLVGFFVNMVVLRIRLSDDPTFAELLQHTRDLTLAAYENQDVPFEKLVNRLTPRRDPSRNPLFQVALQFLGGDTAGSRLDLCDVEVDTTFPTVERSRFDLGLTFVESPGTLQLMVEYATDLFDAERIDRMCQHLERTLCAAVDDPSVRLSRVPLLTEAERADLLAIGRGPELSVRWAPVHAIIADRAATAPDATALVFHGETIAYGRLDRRAEMLARRLRSLGVCHGDVVAVALTRGVDAYISLLGVLKSGAAFVVLDTAHPTSRLAYILKDTAAVAVVTDSGTLSEMPEPDGWTPMCLDREWKEIESADRSVPLDEWATADSLAYVLYTSGSTGLPKGVLVQHRALLPMLRSFIEIIGIGPADRMLQFCALTFDMAETELFACWSAGGALVSASQETLTSPPDIARLIHEERPTYVGATPSVIKLLDPQPHPYIRKILVGGEACPPELVNRWNAPSRQFFNGYGPTEAAACTTLHLCEPDAEARVTPIGAPMSHRFLYVVDRRGNLVPRGVPGELLIGGDEGLARGYLHQPELTAARFVADPFRATGRVYRTGDLVRWNRDGQLEFVGRIDTQVKLRGLRIELEEIETVLARDARVAHAVVALREIASGDKCLVGYVVPAGQPPTVDELRDVVVKHLPPYMAPVAWVFLDALPLSASGKVNRGALPAPNQASVARRAFNPPANPIEQEVADLFAEVLSVSPVGRDDDFFLLGGDSLRAVRVVSRVSTAFGVQLRIRTLYAISTVRELAEHIGSISAGPGVPCAEASVDPARLELLSRIEALSEEEAERLLAAHHALLELREGRPRRGVPSQGLFTREVAR
jgi:amino acid adenylation domain-containing protein